MSNFVDDSEPAPLRQINTDLLRSLSLKTENNLLDFIVIFIDHHLEKSDDCELLLSDLQSIINDPIHYFDTLDSSLTFIQAHGTTKIFLIISGSFGETNGHYFFELVQIECIYVFCHNCSKHKYWADTVEKIRGVLENKTQLLNTLCRDVKTFASRWSFFDEASFQKASDNDGRWYQLFIRVLIHQIPTENSWEEMLHECRSFYKQNPKMQEKINDFERNYTADQAIKYYCQDSFVYRIINCALRTHNIDLIIKFQPYIKDLYNELQKKYWRRTIDFYKRRTETPLRVVYRGQYMSKAELAQLKYYCQSRNSHIVLNTFGSATRDPTVALQFIPDDCPGHVRCLFQIIIPDYHYTKASMSSIVCHQFVDITDQGSNEQEVLFGVGSLFRIKYIGRFRSDLSLTFIVLELHADTEEIGSYWNVLIRRIQTETDDMRSELLQFIQNYTKRRSELNWIKWWQYLERECGIQKYHDESLVMIMYEGFNDPESIAKVIELRKRSSLVNNPSMFQSERISFDLLLKQMKIKKPTGVIALYELFLKFCEGNIHQSQDGFNDATKVFEHAGDAYENFHFYTQNASNCYRKALELAVQNSDDERIQHLQRKLTRLSSKTSVRKFNHTTDVPKKRLREAVSPLSEYGTQLAKMIHYEMDYDQWLISREFQKSVRQADCKRRMELRLSFLHKYLNQRERWIDNCDLRIVFRMPLQQQRKTESPKDVYQYLLLAVWHHLHEDVNEGNHILNLWHYEKYMHEWLALNDIKKTLMFYEAATSTNSASIVCTINRLIKKLELIITCCTLMISLLPRSDLKAFTVDVNRIGFVRAECTSFLKLVFFDERI